MEENDMNRNNNIIAWNELTPTQQAILWTMAKYEKEISSGRNSHRAYTVTRLYHFAQKFYSIKEEEFCRVLYAMAEGTDLVEARDNEAALRISREAVLQQNSGEPYVVLEKLTDAIARIQGWSSGDIATLTAEDLADIWDYMDEYCNLGLDFCSLPPTREYGERLENLLDSVRELSWELRRKIVKDGRLSAV